MGYRSEVTAVFYAVNDAEKLSLSGSDILARLKAAYPEVFAQWPAGHWTVEDRYLKFEANSYKWYREFPEVAEFDRTVTDLITGEEDDQAITYEFTRIGEDPDDIEQEGNGVLGLLRVVRDPMVYIDLGRCALASE
jgi:hypothetical protein